MSADEHATGPRVNHSGRIVFATLNKDVSSVLRLLPEHHQEQNGQCERCPSEDFVLYHFLFGFGPRLCGFFAARALYAAIRLCNSSYDTESTLSMVALNRSMPGSVGRSAMP